MTVQLIRHTWKATREDNFGLGLAEEGVVKAIEYGTELRQKGYHSLSVGTSPVVRAIGTGFIIRAAYEGADRDTLIGLVRGYDSAAHLEGHPYAPALDSRLKYTDPSPIAAYSSGVITLDEAVRECHELLDDDKVPAHSTDLESDRYIARADVARYITVLFEAAEATLDGKDFALRIGHEPCVSGVQYVAADSKFFLDCMIDRARVGVAQPLQGITIMNSGTTLIGMQPRVTFENGTFSGITFGTPVIRLKQYLEQYGALQ